MQKLTKTLLAIMLTSLTATLAAAPVGYSINADSPTDNADSLYRLDLGTGAETRIAPVRALGQVRIDVEGLAFAADGTLYAVDDDTLTFFPLNPDNALVDVANEKTIKFPSPTPGGGANDFGMSFACDGNLYLTSIIRKSLYRMDLDGNLTVVGGAEGKLDPVKINAIAAYGEPVRLYGLGSGADEGGVTETPNLYELDLTTGTANLVGPLGGAAGPYLQGGLAFDDAGQLWAVTEGALFDWDSQVMKIDTATGTASEVKTLAEPGFESLAITVPRGCEGAGEGDVATFTVQKQYLDGNDETPVTLNIRCNTGLPLEQTTTAVPNPGPFGEFEVNFTVGSFEDGELDCEVWESAPESYTPSYECFSTGSCTATESGCRYTSVSAAQENLCTIRNYPDPVVVEVSKEWVDSREGLEIDHRARVALECESPYDGDGEWVDGVMRWSWEFEDDTPTQTATVYPRFSGATQCRTIETLSSSAVESVGTCSEWQPVQLGAGTLVCAITNTIFYEGIPTLNPFGLAIAALVLLLTGLFATRRF
jgi:hypothetical protein